MATLVFGMNQSLDGYVDHTAFAPSPVLFRHFIERIEEQTACVYGRRMYEVMRYWDDDQPEWDADERAYASAWQGLPKWVVSRSLESVGTNATLVADEVERVVAELKESHEGQIEVAGPTLASGLSQVGLVDEFHIYVHPVVLGHGKAYFAGPRAPLRLVDSEQIEDVVRLVYVPA